MMTIGIFGGSFDPVHNEHISVCLAAQQSLKTDKLFVVPTYLAPHKTDKKATEEEHRLAMCRLAFEGIDGVEVDESEIKAGGTSYTYLTVERFLRRFPEAKLYFIVGTDMLRDFKNWRYPERILKTATLAVCARDEQESWAKREQAEFLRRFQQEFAIIPYNGKPVSSTKLRALAACKELKKEDTPERVCEYIRREKLYEVKNVDEVKALQKPSRWAHTVRVAAYAAEHAKAFGVDERAAIVAAIYHDCAKNLTAESPMLDGFIPPQGVPESVWHQYAGAYLAQHRFGVHDEDILNAIRYHTSGRENMSALEKLIFLSDMLEEGRTYPEAEEIRNTLEKEGVDKGLELALQRTLEFLTAKGAEIYPLTKKAYEYIKERRTNI